MVLAWLIVAGCRPTPTSSDPPASTIPPAATNDQPDLAGIRFVDDAARRGLNYVWPQQQRPLRANDAQGCGCALFDFDDDGWQDVLLVARPHPRLYRNTGGGQFEDITQSVGLADLDGYWIGCAVGDYNGDGRQDLLLTGIHHLALLQNSGSGFSNVTEQAGLDPSNRGHWGTSAGFMDLDGDGFHDLVLLNYVEWGSGVKEYCEYTPGIISGCTPHEYVPERGELWRNTGQGRFELVPEENCMQSTGGVCLVLAFIDLDDDGRMDFYLGNDGVNAEMLMNRGDMRFDNIGHFCGLAMRQATPMAAMGADWADYDRDGRLDLAVTNFQELCYAVYRNQGGSVFSDVSAPTGVADATRQRLGFGAKWLDMDNDGWPDLCFANGHVYDNVDKMEPPGDYRQPTQLMRNLQGQRFVDLAGELGGDVARPLIGRGSATGDIDNDGRIDVLVVDYEGPVMLLHNESQTPHHWITLDLRSAPPNALAFGARAEARTGGQVWINEVSPATSFLSASDPRIHWGLGETDKLETLTIRWPSGRQEEFHDLSVDRIVRIEEGKGEVGGERRKGEGERRKSDG
ncbi:MAG: CRTAC1 family protein [Pirellulales bacterium]